MREHVKFYNVDYLWCRLSELRDRLSETKRYWKCCFGNAAPIQNVRIYQTCSSRKGGMSHGGRELVKGADLSTPFIFLSCFLPLQFSALLPSENLSFVQSFSYIFASFTKWAIL